MALKNNLCRFATSEHEVQVSLVVDGADRDQLLNLGVLLLCLFKASQAAVPLSLHNVVNALDRTLSVVNTECKTCKVC